jgi:hypothetical protein
MRKSTGSQTVAYSDRSYIFAAVDVQVHVRSESRRKLFKLQLMDKISFRASRRMASYDAYELSHVTCLIRRDSTFGLNNSGAAWSMATCRLSRKLNQQLVGRNLFQISSGRQYAGSHTSAYIQQFCPRHQATIKFYNFATTQVHATYERAELAHDVAS